MGTPFFTCHKFTACRHQSYLYGATPEPQEAQRRSNTVQQGTEAGGQDALQWSEIKHHVLHVIRTLSNQNRPVTVNAQTANEQTDQNAIHYFKKPPKIPKPTSDTSQL